ncbi:MAG: hypothetical protein RSF67_05650, partial [Clostridia bacterium]
MNITMTREEIREVLGVGESGMKSIIRREKLQERLEELGYSLVSIERVGLNTMYNLELNEIDEWIQYQRYRNIKKKEEHTEYVENRVTPKGMKYSRRKFLEETKIDISETTAGRYDKMMLEDEIMQKDEAMYLLFNPKTEEFQEITEEGYKTFWRESHECKYQLAHNKLRYNRKEIPEATYESNYFMIMTHLGKEKGVVALKYDTYKEFTNTIRTLEMIKKHKTSKNSHTKQ